MPTRTDFEDAAAKFRSAADMVDALAAGAEAAAARRVLQGGVLGREVPQRLAEATAVAAGCRDNIDAAADECLVRAALIASYEAQVAAYDAAIDNYETARLRYSGALDLWWLNTDGTVAHPGEPPVRPEKPEEPPAWADVRRP